MAFFTRRSLVAAIVHAAARHRRRADLRLHLTNPQRARATWLAIVEFRGFSARSAPSGMIIECQHAAYRLRRKKPLPWRVTGTDTEKVGELLVGQSEKAH